MTTREKTSVVLVRKAVRRRIGITQNHVVTAVTASSLSGILRHDLYNPVTELTVMWLRTARDTAAVRAVDHS
jgi:hypothetical protein